MISKIGIDDLKFYAVNLSTLGVSLAHVNEILSSLTLILGIGYGIHRWALLIKGNKSKA